ALNLERSASSAREGKGTAKTSNFIGYPTSKRFQQTNRTSFGCWSICLLKIFTHNTQNEPSRKA
ncbi:MAG: hypothetical protein SOZ78_01930, partial [Eubacteriales bacterium]|nr:hypothetical protein [Eubacteriales bacterium]